MSKVRYFVFRTVQTVILLWLVVTFLFFLFRLMPGSYTGMLIAQGASQETIEAAKARWGLDEPLYIQYIKYMTNFVVGDVGNSFKYGQPVFEYVKMKIFNSFILIAPGITVAYILASIYGTILGTNRDTLLEEYGVIPVVMIGMFPQFFIGMLLIVIFSSWLGLLPAANMIPISVSRRFSTWYGPYLTVAFLKHYILPFSTVVLWALVSPTLIMRTSVVEVLGQDFSYFQRITGIPKKNRLQHLGRHAILPLITLYPVVMTRAIGGIVLIELVFNWPGIGAALVEAVFYRDFPVIMFVFILVATFVIISNYIVDVVYGIIDPRISVSGGD